MDSLKSIQDEDSNDFWSAETKDDQFVHALELDEEDDCRLSDVETVRSEWSKGSRRNSICSETESISCEESQLLSLH